MSSFAEKLLKIKEVKTIKGREDILKGFLHEHGVGQLTDEEDKQIKWLFEMFYTPDEDQIKYPVSDIDRFYIGRIPGRYTTGFRIRRKVGEDHNATYKRLAGGNRTSATNIKRALRHAIRPQIEEFRKENPLNPLDICPIENKPLGSDAEVDHYDPTFSELAKQWLEENKKIKAIPKSESEAIYVLEEPSQSNWIRFHKEKARLRWLSKEGNRRAHLL